MKMIVAICSLLFAFCAFASQETRTFHYDGTQDSVNMSLRAEETHTEYRIEQYRTTCYRQVVHYRTTCTTTGSGQRICQTYPHYTQQPYSCIQTVRIPYEVKDYDVEANVLLSVDSLPASAVGETFKVTLDGDELTLSAVGSKKYIIILKKSELHSSIRGSVKFVDASFVTTLVEAAPVVRALELSNVSISGSMLNFKVGPVDVPHLLGFSLNITKAPVFGSNNVLIDRELADSEIELKAQGAGSAAAVNIKKLGVELSSGRHLLTPKIFFKHPGRVLNASQFSHLEMARTLIYKIR